MFFEVECQLVLVLVAWRRLGRVNSEVPPIFFGTMRPFRVVSLVCLRGSDSFPITVPDGLAIWVSVCVFYSMVHFAHFLEFLKELVEG